MPSLYMFCTYTGNVGAISDDNMCLCAGRQMGEAKRYRSESLHLLFLIFLIVGEI